MWVENNEKVREKTYLRSDIESNITDICDASNHVHEIILAINRISAGSISGADKQMIDDCKLSLQEMSKALQKLHICRNIVEQLETREWVDDK